MKGFPVQRLSILMLLLAIFSLPSDALDGICPDDSPEFEITSAEPMEAELAEDETNWYFFDAETINEVWRFDIETSKQMELAFYTPAESQSNSPEAFRELSLEAEALSTAIRTIQEDFYCFELANKSDESIEYSLTVRLLEANDGRLEGTEGLDSRGNNVVGVYYNNLGNYEVALEYFALAIEQNPDDPTYWNNTCLTLRDSGRYADAIDYCTEAIELDPDSAYYPYDTGITLQALGDYESAEAYFEDAAELDSGDYNFYFALGMNHVFLGNPDEAIEAFDEYLDISEFWYAPYWRALAYLNAGEYNDAIDDLEQAIDDFEEEPALYHLWLGIAHLAKGDEDAAAEAIEEAEERFEDEEDELTLNRTMAFYSVFVGDNEEAEAYYSIVLEAGDVFRRRGDLFYLTVLSNTFPDEESYSEALDWLKSEMDID
jgi:tetratricopeptide (TPR) repeat protein